MTFEEWIRTDEGKWVTYLDLLTAIKVAFKAGQDNPPSEQKKLAALLRPKSEQDEGY